MIPVKILWILSESLIFSMFACLFLNISVKFRFHAKICITIYWILSFVYYVGYSFKTLNQINIELWNTFYFFILLLFFILTISEKIYHSLLTLVIQLVMLAVSYKLISLLLSIFIPLTSPENFTDMNQFLMYIPYKILYLLIIYVIYRNHTKIKNFIFALPLIYIIFPYQIFSYISKKYLGNVSFQSTYIFSSKNTFFLSFAITALLFTIFLCYHFFKKNNLAKSLSDKEYVTTLQTNHIKKMNTTLLEASKFRHDLNNYITVLKTMTSKNDIGKATALQHTLVVSCDQLVDEFSVIAEVPVANKSTTSSTKFNDFINIINTSELISLGFLIIHFYFSNINFNIKGPFAIPSYILILGISIFIFIRKKATTKEVIIMLIGLIYSILFFIIQANFDSLFLLSIPLILFFFFLTMQHTNKSNKTFTIINTFVFSLLIVLFSFLTTKYNTIYLTFVFLFLFFLFFIISILYQNKSITAKLSQNKETLVQTQIVIDESKLFVTTFKEFKDQILCITTDTTVNTVLKKYDRVFYHYKTGSSVINAILSSKEQRCTQSNIQLHTNILFSKENKIDEFTLGRLLFNLLDNAMEAAETSPENLRKIQLSLICNETLIYIKIRNSKSSYSRPLKNKMKTTKAIRGHGYGLSIINDIVNKYNGSLDFIDLGEQFETTIVLEMNA